MMDPVIRVEGLKKYCNHLTFLSGFIAIELMAKKIMALEWIR